MVKYRNQYRRKSQSLVTDKQLLGELYNVYYNNKDLKLLLDLLAESSGIAPSIRILSLFDPEFRSKSEVRALRVKRSVTDEKGDAAVVEFEDAMTVRDIFSEVHEIAVIYTVEITPPTSRSSVVVFNLDHHGEGGCGGGRTTVINEVSSNCFILHDT